MGVHFARNLASDSPESLNNVILKKYFRLLLCYDLHPPNGVEGKAPIQAMFSKA